MEAEPQIFDLPGGATGIVQESHDTPVVSIMFFIRVGAADETPKQAGLAHLHEHMIFKGTPTRPVGRIAQEVEAAGGDINAYTTFDHTCYYTTMASRYWTVGLDVLGDALQNADFDADELAKELNVIFEEMKRSDDSPGQRVGQKLFQMVFKPHPYANPIIGTRKVLSQMKRADVLNFFRKYYKPSNTTVVIAGDIDATDAKKRLTAIFAAAKKTRITRPKRGETAPQRSPRIGLQFGEVNEATFEIGYPAPGIGDPRAVQADVLSIILGGGESSRLHRQVRRRRRLVYDAVSYSYNLADAGIFITGGVCDPQKTMAAVKAVLDQVQQLRRRPVTEAELDKAKRNIESWFIFERETPTGLAKKLGYSYLVEGDLEFDDRYLAQMLAVTRDDLLGYARDYLSPKTASLSAMLPSEYKAKVTSAALKSILTKAKEPTAKAKPNGRPADTLVAFNTQATHAVAGKRHRTKMATLSNGVRVIVKESTQAPIVSMKICLQGGTRFETRRTAGISRFVANMLTRGTKQRDAEAFADEVEAIAASINGFSGRNSLGISADCLSKDFERIVALSAEALLEPAFDAEEVELQRQEQVAAIARREDSLTRRSIDLFYETLYRKHPYGFPTLGTAESVPLITVSQLRGFHRRMMRPEDLVVGVAGDVRVEDVVKLLEGAFGGLRSRTAAPKTPVPEAPVVEPRQAVLRRDKAQAHLVIGFLGTTVDAADRHAMEILNAIFSGQGGRLFIELRDKRHLAYSVTSFHQEGVEPGAFAIYIGTTHANVDKAREGIWQEIRRVRDEPMDARELEDAKRYLIGSNDIDLAGLSTVAQSMALDELLGLSYKETFRQARRLQSVTAAQVQAVARRYLREDASVEALITKSAK